MLNVDKKNPMLTWDGENNIHNIPTIQQYTYGVRQFLKESKNWDALSDVFYTVSNRFGYEESCDAANGGLSCKYFFKKKPTKEEIRERYFFELSEHVRILSENTDFSDEEEGERFALDTRDFLLYLMNLNSK